MKVGIQWSLAQARDWTWLEVDDTPAGRQRWRQLPKRPIPRGGEALDAPGFVFDVVIQGISLRGFDHYAVEPTNRGVKAWVWNDDLDDDGTDYAHGRLYEFREGWCDRTAYFHDGTHIRHQGPDQRLTIYAEDMEAHRATDLPRECGGVHVELRPWSEWPAPSEEAVRHGVWVDDPDGHIRAARLTSFEEWL